MIGQCCNFHGINSTVEIARDIFFLNFSRLRHLVNNVAIHIYGHDYIRMEIAVLFLEIFNGRKYTFTGSTNASPVNSIFKYNTVIS